MVSGDEREPLGVDEAAEGDRCILASRERLALRDGAEVRDVLGAAVQIVLVGRTLGRAEPDDVAVNADEREAHAGGLGAEGSGEVQVGRCVGHDQTMSPATDSGKWQST